MAHATSHNLSIMNPPGLCQQVRAVALLVQQWLVYHLYSLVSRILLLKYEGLFHVDVEWTKRETKKKARRDIYEKDSVT